MLVNDVGYEKGLKEFTLDHDLPVLQDTVDERATSTFNAHKWYVYLIDRDQQLRRIHYHLNMPAELPRLAEAIDELVAEEGS